MISERAFRLPIDRGCGLAGMSSVESRDNDEPRSDGGEITARQANSAAVEPFIVPVSLHPQADRIPGAAKNGGLIYLFQRQHRQFGQ
ncbi:MAG: hypothetical protein JWQ21_1192 [Herminiimonas sp.]|nr:hypothetical protein [Herminiimonas sp.]